METKTLLPAPMTAAEAFEEMQKGRLLLIGEVRTFKDDLISWRDKTTGRSLQAEIMRLNVESADETFPVSLDLPLTPDQSRKMTCVEFLDAIAIKKGDRAVLVIKKLETTKGQSSLQAKSIHKLTPAKPAQIGGK